MAHILKFPNKNGKGVLSFTNLEESYLRSCGSSKISLLKRNWILLLHPNYHIEKYTDDGLFDAFITTEELFDSSGIKKSKILGFRAFDFTPQSFFPGEASYKKHYDFIAVSRVQPDKNVIGFLRVLKNVLSKNKDAKAVLLLAVPGLRPLSTNNIRAICKRMYTQDEINRFDLLTVDYDLPFPLSRNFISTLYNSSRVYLCTHLKEQNHARVIAYAQASALPIVCYKNIIVGASSDVAKQPFYYVAKSESEISDLALKALDDLNNPEILDALKSQSRLMDSSIKFNELKNKIKLMFFLDEYDWQYADDLDICIAKHNHGIRTGNTYFATVDELVSMLCEDPMGLKTVQEIDEYVFNRSTRIMRFEKLFRYKLYLLARSLKVILYKFYSRLAK